MLANHPNTEASGKTTLVTLTIGAAVAYLNSRWGWHIDKTTVVGAVFSAAILAAHVRLYLGKNPLVPTLRKAWRKYVTGLVA